MGKELYQFFTVDLVLILGAITAAVVFVTTYRKKVVGGCKAVKHWFEVPLKIEHMIATSILPTITHLQKEMSLNGGNSQKDAIFQIRDSLAVLNSRSLFTLSKFPIGFFECDKSGACIFVNDEMSSVFGLTTSEMMGHGWMTNISETDRYVVWDKWTKFIKDGVPYNTTYTVINPETETKYLCHSAATPHRSIRGDILGYVGTVEVKEELKL